MSIRHCGILICYLSFLLYIMSFLLYICHCFGKIEIKYSRLFNLILCFCYDLNVKLSSWAYVFEYQQVALFRRFVEPLQQGLFGVAVGHWGVRLHLCLVLISVSGFLVQLIIGGTCHILSLPGSSSPLPSLP